MKKNTYSIGIDFGTESARAILVHTKTGEEAATHVAPYPDGVITNKLPRSEVKLQAEYALQNPNDYLYALKVCVQQVVQNSDVSPEQIIGIGVDFTSNTMIPVDSQLIPLCNKAEFKNNPHAWAKLWKHHVRLA